METLTRSPPPFLCWEKAFLKIFFFDMEENTKKVFVHLDDTTGPTKYEYIVLERLKQNAVNYPMAAIRGGFGPRPEPESPKISPKMAGPKKPEARKKARRAFWT